MKLKTYTFTYIQYAMPEGDRQHLLRAELKLVKLSLSATKLFVFTTLGIWSI